MIDTNLNSKNIKNNRTDVSMFILAILPVLNIYMFFGTPLTLAQTGIILVILLNFRMNIRFFDHLTLSYILCWFYVAFHLIFFVEPHLNTYFIPGGINFFLFTLGWLVFSKIIDANRLNKIVNYVFVFAFSLFVVQNVTYYYLGYNISVILPFGENLNYNDMTFSELQIRQITRFGNRFASIFAEPSYWGQYCVVALCLELFSPRNVNKLFTTMSVFIAATLLAIQSGVGILCLFLIGILKLIQIFFIKKDRKKIKYLFILIPLIVLVGFYYVNSTSGQSLVERGDNISTIEGEGGKSSFMRLFFGWEFIANLSASDLFWGLNEIIPISADGTSFFNGVTYFIVTHGLVGTFFLCIFYVSKSRKNGYLAAAMTIVLLSISLMEAIYLAPTMLVATSIIASPNRNIK